MASKRGNPTFETPNRRRQRSLSVSAASRRTTQLQPNDDVPSQFSNKRENPLFWTTRTSTHTHSPPDQEFNSENAPSDTSSKVVTGHRGRSVTRNSGLGNKKETGRSLSGVRGRSVSRGHYGHGNRESEVEQESRISSLNRSAYNLSVNNVTKRNTTKNRAESRSQMKSLQVQTNRHPAVQCLDASASHLQICNRGESISTDSLSEAEEKTIRAVCEQMKAVRMNNTIAVASANFADVAPDLVNPEAVELVLDIRGEYTRKLEESQARARKLRTDLAVEEQRGQELSRILTELLPDPNRSAVQRCPKRGTSNERKKMSKHLTEDAMAYFDECVSISTFDSSDFSATEDQPLNAVGASIAVGGSASITQMTHNISAFSSPSNCFNHVQVADSRHFMDTCKESSFMANNSSPESMINPPSRSGEDGVCGWKFQFSNALQEDKRNSSKHFEKDMGKDDIEVDNMRSKHYDLEGYNSWSRRESFLFERVIFNKRLETGSLHLCGGGFALSFCPFASFI